MYGHSAEGAYPRHRARGFPQSLKSTHGSGWIDSNFFLMGSPRCDWKEIFSNKEAQKAQNLF